MSTQIEQFTKAPNPLDDQDVFDVDMARHMAEELRFVTQANQLGSEMQTNADIAAALILAMALPQFAGTSTTSVTVGTGARTFTTQAGKGWLSGQIVVISSGANYVKGTVTDYTGTDLELNVTSINGSGTYASWNIGLSYDGLALAASGDNNDIRRLSGLTSGINAVGIGSRIMALPTPSVAANAMTMPSETFTLDFRSATLGAGGVTMVTSAPAPLTIPEGATLGGTSGVAQDLAWLALNVGGSIEYAVVDASGGVNLSELGVISTTAISAAADSESTVYSNTARTDVPYRLLGFTRSTQAVAGQWVAVASLVLCSVSPLALWLAGYGQKSRVMTASRANGSTYYNTTGRTKWVNVYWRRGANTLGYVVLTTVVNGFTTDVVTRYYNTTDESVNTGWIPVPADGSFSVTQVGLPNGMVWNERY